MTKNQLFGMVAVCLMILLALALLAPRKVGATANCDWYEQHPPDSEHPDGWGECKYFTPTPTDPTQEVTPTPEPTDEVTPTLPAETPEVTPTDDPSATPTPIGTPSKHSCERKCVYNQSGIPGTHSVTAVSPNGDGLYTWQVKFGDVWYDVYDCYGVIVTTAGESRGETTIVRLTVDGSAPTDANSYRISGGAEAILFDDFGY